MKRGMVYIRIMLSFFWGKGTGKLCGIFGRWLSVRWGLDEHRRRGEMSARHAVGYLWGVGTCRRGERREGEARKGNEEGVKM